jgi:hypothetical protein
LLKRSGKKDYIIIKAWKPILFLSTFGKVFESIIVKRISYAIKKYELLPTNHFKAWKQRSAKQVIILSQKYIYKAWYQCQIFSLISFNIKNAYNSICKKRLVQKLQARKILKSLVHWIDAFCSSQTTIIKINGQTFKKKELLQAGLLQESPLSSILFLFFNTNLIQHKINKNGSSVAFVDNYMA